MAINSGFLVDVPPYNKIMIEETLSFHLLFYRAHARQEKYFEDFKPEKSELVCSLAAVQSTHVTKKHFGEYTSPNLKLSCVCVYGFIALITSTV